jgi:hypothetical protein
LKNIHSDYVAAVALGDYLAETIIFGTNAETALKEAIENAVAMYEINMNGQSENVIERAWDFVQGWLVSNTAKFSHDATPYYGKTTPSADNQSIEYFVIPQYLDQALIEGGFNIKKTMAGFKERGYIQIEKDSCGKKRTKSLGRIDGKVLRGYVFKLENEGICPLNSVNNHAHKDVET